ncbi:SOS response-associated peptidase family protein [Novosphingobium sp. JCM 18896]|uniref:SOS response-associated peptidase family protein n=1 Tax=Novosphingobium sp. JCM 18896 TaxID=2989731 RepID=UPI002223B5EA|nr:SOS response-associated peptidase family protein [Novosphingobium sp. JCM 18896]MCW1430194.1 hypothetical protein [Novosphingobium sp. JCM 18896]
MVALYRCRTSLREVAELFSAVIPPSADWHAEVWPGQTGLVIVKQEGHRLALPMTWGLPAGTVSSPAPGRSATTIWFRELWPRFQALLAPEHRCVIVIEAFAKPDRHEGRATRTWFGSDDIPLLGWPGIWRNGPQGPGFSGFLVAPGEIVDPHDSMPALLAPGDAANWLDKELVEASFLVRRKPSVEGMYRDPTEEPWVTPRSR